MRGMMLLLVVALLLPVSAAAQESEPFYAVAPVQVEVRMGNRNYSYDCFPSAQHQGENKMAVYFNTPNGLAIYACETVGRTLVIPAVPTYGIHMADWFGGPTVPEGGEA